MITDTEMIDWLATQENAYVVHYIIIDENFPERWEVSNQSGKEFHGPTIRQAIQAAMEAE